MRRGGEQSKCMISDPGLRPSLACGFFLDSIFLFFFSGVRGRDSGAERSAVENLNSKTHVGGLPGSYVVEYSGVRGIQD